MTEPSSSGAGRGTTAILAGCAGILLIGGVLALGLVPDEAVLRGKAFWGRILLVGAAASAILSQAAAGRVALPWTPFLAAALGPVLVAALFVLHTPVVSPSLARDETLRLLVIPLMALAGGVLLGTPGRRSRFLVALGASTLFAAVYAVLQRIGGLLPLGIEPAVRAHGGFGNPVFLGAFLVLTTPLLLAEALLGTGRRRWLFAVVSAFALAAILATGSAGALLGLGAAILLGLCLVAGRSRALAGGLALLAVSGVLVVGTRLGTILRPRAHDIIWRDTWRMFLEHPNGVGPGQYQLAFLPYASDELLAIYPRTSSIVNDAHSEPLQLLAELGVPGFLAVLVTLVTLVLCVRRTLGTDAPDRHRLAAALGGALGSVTQSLVSPDLRFGVTSLLLGLLLGLAAAFAHRPARPFPMGRIGRAGWAALGVAVLVLAAHDARARLHVARLVQPDTPPRLARPDVDEARLAALRRAARDAPDDVQAHFDLGVALTDAARDPAAIASFERALALAPGHGSILRNLGLVESRSGRDADAVRHLAPVVAAAPDDVLARLMLAWSLLRTGDVAEATHHARDVLQRSPEHPDARYLLAYLGFVQGDVRTALEQIEALLRSHPDHAKGRLLLEVLRE